ncbi:MAG TPA: DUF4388 domain-containing protein [Thermoanaerobaculia bacterium]|nr:DUF4388 domain-containing protein [Thermoanaerobaculia bacterium]
MDKKFEYRGDLAVTPLAEILATIHRYRVPGVVTASRDGRVRRIYLDDGLVVFAASNEREMSLPAWLLRRGWLKPEAALEAEERRSREGIKIGQALLQLGFVTPERLNEGVGGQIREILWGAFDWDSGDVLFEIGGKRAGELVRIDAPIPEVILEGIRRAADVKRLVARLGSGASVLERTRSPLLDLFLPEERAFYEAIDGRTPLQVLASRGPGTLAENARILYAFYCLGLVRKLRGTGAGARKIQYRTEGGSLGS